MSAGPIAPEPPLREGGGGLGFRERPAAGAPSGLLVLHHGRGTDERELLTLGEVLDPRHRLHVAAPRAPHPDEGAEGRRWYLVPRPGLPDPGSFAAAYGALASFHDELWRETGIGPERTLLAGFSMGASMGYALGLAADRPRPAGLMAFSGFLPRVEGWQAQLSSRRGLGVFAANGRQDRLLPIALARETVEQLRAGGLLVEYRESEAGHRIDPRELPAASEWLERSPLGQATT